MNQTVALYNQALGLEITQEDAIMLQRKTKANGQKSTQNELMTYNENQSLVPISEVAKRVNSMFSDFYDLKTARSVSNDLLLNAFKPLIDTAHKDIYENMKILSESAAKFVKLINKIKVIHSDILFDLKALNTRIGSKYGRLQQAFNLEAEGESNLVQQVIENSDFSRYVKNCEDGIKKMTGMCEEFDTVCNLNEESLKQVLCDHDVRDALNNLDNDIKKHSEAVSVYQDELAKTIAAKIEFDNEFNYRDLKIKQIESLAKQQEKLQEMLVQDIEKLEKSKSENEAKKLEIVSSVNDVKKFESILKDNEAICKQFDDEYTKSLMEINKKADETTKEISNLTQVYKNYHLIFILDESGSMRPYFNSVKASVKRVVENRRNQPVVNDRWSVIRFNSTARTEVLNAEVKEAVELSNCKGGDTKFIPALDNLSKLLMEINSNLFIPIVFFLSDGYGESMDVVLQKCHQVRNQFARMDMIFFCIGYGSDADIYTLNSMAFAFNNNKDVIHIGEEMCPLYYSVSDEAALDKAFTAYEKLFVYQKSILKTKSDLYQGLLKEKEAMNKKTYDCINQMSKMKHETRELAKTEASKQTKSLEDVNKNIDVSIVNLKNQLNTSKQIWDALQNEKKTYSDEIAKQAAERSKTEENLTIKQKDLNESKRLLDKFKKKKNDETSKMIENLDKNREDDYNRVREHFEQLGLDLPPTDDFKRKLTNFTQNYYKYKRQIEDIVVKSNDIKNEFNGLVDKIRTIKDDLIEFHGLTRENLRLKIWGLVVIYYEKEHSIVTRLTQEKGTVVSSKDILTAICKKRMGKFTMTDKEALALILKVETPQLLFSKMEQFPKFAEEFIDKHLEKKLNRTQIDEGDNDEEPLDEAEKQKKMEEKQQRIAEAKEKLKEINKTKKAFDACRLSVERILEDLNEARLLVKEIYLKSFFNFHLRNQFNTMKESILPNIDQLQIAYNKNS